MLGRNVSLSVGMLGRNVSLSVGMLEMHHVSPVSVSMLDRNELCVTSKCRNVRNISPVSVRILNKNLSPVSVIMFETSHVSAQLVE